MGTTIAPTGGRAVVLVLVADTVTLVADTDTAESDVTMLTAVVVLATGPTCSLLEPVFALLTGTVLTALLGVVTGAGAALLGVVTGACAALLGVVTGAGAALLAALDGLGSVGVLAPRAALLAPAAGAVALVGVFSHFNLQVTVSTCSMSVCIVGRHILSLCGVVWFQFGRPQQVPHKWSCRLTVTALYC